MEIKTGYNSTFAIGGVSCSADSLVVAESFVLRININSKNPTHRKSAKRCAQFSIMGIKSIYINLFFLMALLQVVPCLSQSNFVKPHFRLLTYGEPSLGPNTYEFIGQKWGIEFYPVAGCLVTQELIDSVKHHNQAIESLINKKYGVDWKTKFESEVKTEIENQDTVIALVEETDFIKKNKTILILESDRINYQLTPISNSSRYHVSIPGWILIQGKKEWVTFYKLLVDYKTKSVTIE